MNRIWAVVGLTALIGCSQQGQPAPSGTPAKAATPASRLALAEKVMTGAVVVEYTLQYDKGESPENANCIREERPFEVAGWLIEPTVVVSADHNIHPRFVKDICVRFGDTTVPATIAGYGRDVPFITLKLARPVPKAKPLAFSGGKGPYCVVGYELDDGHWTTTVMPMDLSVVARSATGRAFGVARGRGVVVDSSGSPVTLMRAQLPLDDSWKTPPTKWALIDQAEMDRQLKALQASAEQAMLRTKLHFRSPKKGAGRGDSGPTEMSAIGVLIGPKRLLVMTSLEPKTTARLDRIEVFGPATGPVPAKFAGTLTDYGAFVAELESPLPGAVKLSAEPIESFRDRLLHSVDIRIQGDQRIVYFVRARLNDFERGWKRRIMPQGGGDNILVDPATGAVCLAPVAQRLKVAVRERYGSDRGVMPAQFLAEALADTPKCFDVANVPLTEEEESRVAWLGVELQAMDADLARANKVADITNNGQTGAMVSYVYPNSPAGKAGVEAGWMLIRLHVPDQPKPVDIQLQHYGDYMERFPWDRLETLPEVYYDRIPRPWPPIENSVTRAMTDLGFGKSFKAEFFVDGKAVIKEFVIENSPPHYDTAPRYTAKDLGLTVRDMTYEVRRYFQKKPDDAGLVVSKIEPGSKSSVAGLKPYEVIIAVNDTPVANVADFEKLVKATKGELRLSVRRMARGRLVKIDMDAPVAKTRPAEPVEE